MSANDVWAVGLDYTSGARTLTMHWNGNGWSVVPSPNVGTESSILYAVDGVTANDVWAIGSHSAQPMILHWNGSQWSLAPTPPLVATEAYLQGIDAVAANDGSNPVSCMTWRRSRRTISGRSATPSRR